MTARSTTSSIPCTSGSTISRGFRRELRPGRLLALAAVVAVANVALSGCGTDAPSATANMPAKNIDQWAMPLDDYQEADPEAASYAELLVDRPCMEQAGYAWNVPFKDSSAKSPTRNAVGRRIFTKSIASNYGYHLAPAGSEDTPEWQAFKSTTNSIGKTEFDKLRECQTKARRVIPVVDDQSNYTAELVSSAIAKATRSDAVAKATAAWRECMLPVGVPDLPESPTRMPSPALVAAYNITDPSSRATSDETRIAQADYQCRVSSGYRRSIYDAEWDAQAQLLKDNADQLERNRAILQRANRQVAKTIAANAPTG